MIFFSKLVVPDGDTVISGARYIGSTNSPDALIANPIQCVFVKGAGATVIVTLQAACIPTPLDQSVIPDDSDFIDVQSFNSDQVVNGASLNGLWARYKIVNTSGADATVTCALS